ncbi:AsmA family protein [Reyranella sp.]|uniref:AsmA family protein n=1 Tax=Reyranella sp. TaxID=1929291 RepID=UPI003D129E18
MASSLRKKVLIGSGSVIALLVVVLIALPFFIDVNAFKPQIAAEVKKATGRELLIDGPIELSLLPSPVVTVQGVKFFNAPGSKNANMVEVKSVTVKPAILPLLSGGIEVDEVTLVEPKIVLEVNAAGKPNWEFTPSVAEAKPAAPKPGPARPLSLGRLTIDNGTLIFSDAKAGLSVVAEKANFTASVGSLDGPYSLAGSATVNGSPLAVDLAVGPRGQSGHSADLSLQVGGGRLAFKGTLSELGPNARLAGTASAAAESLSAFVGTLSKLVGQPEPVLPPLLVGKFSFDGGIEASQAAFAAKNFKVVLGQDSGSGSVSVSMKPELAIDARLALPKIDFDRTLAVMSQAAAPSAAARPATATPAAPAASSGGLPANLTLKAMLEIGELIYNKKPVRNVALELDAKGGAVAVPKLTATLPGDMVLQARSTLSGDPARPTVSGEFSLVGPKLRETLAWLEVDVASVPQSKLNRLNVKGRMASSGGKVQVSGVTFEVDDLKGTGGITVTLGVPLAIAVSVDIDTMDLDSYLAPPPQKPASAAAKPAGPAVAGPTVALKAKVAKLIYRKDTIGGIDVDIALQGTTLRLNDIKVGNLVGARLAVRGSVANFQSAMPRPDIAFNFEAPDMGRVLKLAGTTAPSGLGLVAASGGVSGTLEQLALREFTVTGMGQSVRASGTLSLPGAAQGALKSVGYKGNITLNGQALGGAVDVALAGARPNIVADLKAATLDLDRIGGAPAARPAGRGKPAAAAKPIDTGPLRSVDGSFRLQAGTLISAPMRIANADLAATLKDGVLTIGHFKGGLFSGSLAFSGVVNGSQPALSLDLKGDVNGISLSEMLRTTSGSNQFGSAIKVTIDGRLNANGITVRAAGATAAQIRGSLAGGANLGGHIFVGADKALQILGGAATGAASGVIDNTLGNVLGAIGQKGNLGVGNLLNAISLVLNRFVNHDSPISGHVDIAGGVLTDKGLVVRGNRATANIDTRTNLVSSTTDTTITFTIAEDPSAAYLITTARGPTSSPSLNVVRGTAKDPPGMVNTLPGVGNVLPGGQNSPVPGVPIPNVPIPVPKIPNIFGR